LRQGHGALVNARIAVGGRELHIDVSRPVMLALALDFAGPQPRHVGAPRARSQPFEAAGFEGSVERGASCNCELITLIPHCNGTHTECVGHLTREPLDAWRVVPAGFLPALLLSVSAEAPGAAGEGSEPAPRPNDRLITRRALERGWPANAPFEARALLIRTLPNTADKRARDYSATTPPYLSHAAARPGATITELAFMPDELADGAYLLELQVPALGGDAVPSRPLLYRLVTPAS